MTHEEAKEAGCKCYEAWVEFVEDICNKFSADKFAPEQCVRCEHDKECHKEGGK